MSLTFERKLPIILFFVFLMLTTIGVVFYQNTVSRQEAIDWQKHSQEVLIKLDDTIASALEVQPAVTAFNVLGIDNYLDPMNRAKTRVSQNIDRLRVLTAADANQIGEVDNLDLVLKQYFADAEKKVNTRKQEGPDESNIGLIWTDGKRTLDQIRASSDKIKAIEIESLQKREQASDRSLSWTVWVLIFSSIAGIISLGLANLVVFSEAKKRRTAQNALVEANQGLEKKIELRTAELSDANGQLKEIAGEREIILLNEKSAREEAEIANRLRDEFMATVSHELRTPLNSILGWARLMKGGTLDDMQSEKALGTIIKNSETQNRLIEDLLDVARIISGKLQLDLVEIDPVEVVSNAIETVRPIAAAKHLNIDISAGESGRMYHIKGDRNRLMQIFTNLLTNAIKFSNDSARIFVTFAVADGAVAISIRDTGRGISREFLPLVFERFRQDSANSSKNGGLGLGLAIVRNLVEIHGGSVSVVSEGEGKGSTFTVTLPTAQHAG